jgi:hypothetical protein
VTADDVQSWVRLFVAINFLVIGVSHMIAPKAWAEFFILLRAQGRAGVFTIAFTTLAFGSIVAAFHNVWSGPEVIVTFFGWAQVLKALIYFVAPDVALNSLARISLERAWIFVAGGAFLAVIGAVLAADYFGAFER